ncbi:MAG: glycosyltransferase family 39 protein [Pirellulaceae bacterium]|nr:glycosyltransferase family 39 protein [Pirellulaceae bacterium]
MNSLGGYRWLLIAILAAALGVRLVAGAWWQQRLPVGQRFAFSDSEGYWELARTLARGEPYEYGPERYRIFRTPGYPLILAGLFLFGGNEPPIWAARMISAVLGTLAVAGVAALGRLLFGERAALVAAAMAAVYPEAIALSTFVLSEAPFCPLFVWQLVAWTKGWQARDKRALIGWSLGAGLLGGLATLMRPSWLLFIPFALAFGLLATIKPRGDSLPKQLAMGGLLLAGLCLAMLPWWIRNYAVAGRFVPTSLQVGASLYDGISPTATGASDMRFVAGFVQTQHAADARHIPPAAPRLFEDRLDQRMQGAALAFARANPGRVAELAGIKLLRMWNLWPNAAELGSTTLRLALATTYLPVMLLAVAGAWRFSRRGWPYVLCWLPAVYFTLLHVIFVSSIRYRQPAMLPLIVLAAGMLVSLVWSHDKPIATNSAP